MNLLDAAAVALVVFAVAAGWRSGALPQVGGLLGAILGGAVAVLGLPLARELLDPLDPQMRAIAVLVGLVTLVAVGEAAGSSTGQWLRIGLGRGFLSSLDRVGGAAVGIAQGLLVVWLAGGLLAAGPVPSLAIQAQKSTVIRTLNETFPPPTQIAAELGQLLDASGLPDVFIGLEPLPAPPVDRPTDPRAEAIAGPARASTVKVTSSACGAVLTGTGFAIARGYVVTNAHVVAGTRESIVNLDGRPFDATTVLFDPALDIALLYAPRLESPVLRFAATDPERGAEGAALGFPQGAGLTVIPAAVTRRIDARGRDIYADQIVTREIVELRAQIDRGDSGGPFILADGTVGGVVFAEAKTDDQVGYALSPTEVSVRVSPGLGRTAGVSTGECID